MIDNSNDGTNFGHKLLLTDKQARRLCKASANNLSADAKLSKRKISKMMQSDKFQQQH